MFSRNPFPLHGHSISTGLLTISKRLRQVCVHSFPAQLAWHMARGESRFVKSHDTEYFLVLQVSSCKSKAVGPSVWVGLEWDCSHGRFCTNHELICINEEIEIGTVLEKAVEIDRYVHARATRTSR